MADSVREEILKAILTALNLSIPTGIPTAIRERSLPLELSSLPAYSFYPLRESPEPVNGRLGRVSKRPLTVRFDIWGQGSIIDQVADPIYQYIIKILTGGNISSKIDAVIEKNSEWEYHQADNDVGVYHLDVEIYYHTLITSPSSNND